MSDIIVSFTSYPERILTIDRVLESVINQTILPNKIILYLSLCEFEKFNEIPDLTKFEKYGFEIHWCDENLKSHKKWFYAFQEYPEDLVITIDDDILYNNTAFENLLKYHKEYPKAVIARRAHLITCNSDESIAPYNEWYTECSLYVGTPRMDLLATTGAGTLFPPHLFDKEIFNKEMFMKICPYADDIWLKVMETYHRVPVVLAEKSWDDYNFLEYQTNSLYENYNKNGGNDEQLKKLLKQYKYTYDGMRMKDCIYSQNQIFFSEVKELKKEELNKVVDKLALRIRVCKKILVYGAGILGKQLYELLQYNHIIEAFIVESVTDNRKSIGDIPVRNYKDYIKGDEKIIIALFDMWESHKVYDRLINEGIDRDRFILLSRLEKSALLEM